MNEARLAALAYALGVVQFLLLGLLAAEALYPGYSISQNFISDLGVGPSAWAFNGSVSLLGLLVLLGTYWLGRAGYARAFRALLYLTGIGALGVGIFNENFGALHGLFSLVAFLFSGLAAIASARYIPSPLRGLYALLGALSLASLALFIGGVDLGLGRGGIERMIVYPVLAWGLLLASQIAGSGEAAQAREQGPR
jgi:hypothetical membrane protein